MTQHFDMIIVGTGFSASFFLLGYLEKAKPNARILVLERGRRDPHYWQTQNRKTSSIDHLTTFVNRNPRKDWVYSPGFGGGSNCWWGVTPRFLPNDFQAQSVYNIGVDWPISYDDLESFYYQAEKIMSISGADRPYPFPRQNPYPQPPHVFTEPDKLLKAAYPNHFFHQPTARARVATANRPPCCANGVCRICPINAKFTIGNELAYLYEDPRVTLLLEATVETVETQAGVATGVTYLQDGAMKSAKGDLIVLGANALFNPHILLRSNILHPLLGRNLHEQVSVDVNVDLDGLDNFQGSTSITGHGYMLYDGSHRAERAGCLMETFNIPFLRPEKGKWRQRLGLKFIFEDLPNESNYVKFNEANLMYLEVVYQGYSDYTQRGIDALPELLPDLLTPLPVEDYTISASVNTTESHILGTVVMGNDPADSVVDPHLIHHQIRNLLVLGGSAFPFSSPSNPTLTISALALWSAHHLTNSA